MYAIRSYYACIDQFCIAAFCHGGYQGGRQNVKQLFLEKIGCNETHTHGNKGVNQTVPQFAQVFGKGTRNNFV